MAGFAASAVLLAAFIAAERRAAHPMLDVRLFRNMRFSAASGAVTVSFFTLLGFIFLMTQYFQFVRGYGPLAAGVHLLPVAASVGAGSVAGTQLAVGPGPSSSSPPGWSPWRCSMAGWRRPPARRSVMASSRPDGAVPARHGPDLGARHRVDHGRYPRAKAGVGSAVNDSTRLVGGTLGVAVIGSVYASVYGSRLTATLQPACPARSQRSRTSPSARRTWPPARSRPMAIRSSGRRCRTPLTPSCTA